MTVTSQRNSITYAGGHRLTGVVARARLRIGRQATAARVPFSLVTRASCAPAKPDCPTAGGIAGELAHGEYGILGVGTGNGGAVTNPLLAMRGRLARTWSLHLHKRAGTIVLGARVPTGRRVVARLPFASRVCLAVGPVRDCVPGLFDSGTFQFQIWGNPLDQAPTQPGTPRVVPGTPVAVSVAGSRTPFWTFNAGRTKSKDTVTVHAGRPFVNFGVQAYYAFTITYDNLSRTLVLSRGAGRS